MRAVTTTLFLVICCAPACGQPSISGIYGDLYYNEEGGDLLGTEIRITKSGGHYVAAVQVAEGVPEKVHRVPVTVTGNRIRFTVIEDDGFHNVYSGRIAETGFDGRSTGLSPTSVSNRLHLLRLKKSYFQSAH